MKKFDFNLNEETLDELMIEIKNAIKDIKANCCPIWQCSGELEYLEERTNWQEPDMKCKNCGNVWLIQKYSNEVEE